MAKMPEGINGHFIGKLGTVVGYYWKGVKVARGMPESDRTKPFSPKELAQQKKFGVMSHFLTNAGILLNMTFAKEAIGKSGYSQAFSYNIKNAIAGEYPDLSINYPAVKLSSGNLITIKSPAAVCIEKNIIQYTWTDNSDEEALSSDRVFTAVYQAEKNIWSTRIHAAGRNDGIFKMDLGKFGGTVVHTWIGLMSVNGKDVCDSIYTGIVEII